eukprot:scaffold358061_cov41-Attheya_sp.AAC.3
MSGQKRLLAIVRSLALHRCWRHQRTRYTPKLSLRCGCWSSGCICPSRKADWAAAGFGAARTKMSRSWESLMARRNLRKARAVETVRGLNLDGSAP